MNGLLDFAGLLIYAVVRILTAPLFFLLYSLLGFMSFARHFHKLEFRLPALLKPSRWIPNMQQYGSYVRKMLHV
ncbi:MAG TPA: hypothetical protein VHK91_10795 [Flavisolibacter sp.]|jgi:hypothetical protein|nr:hypothetical protein [Flavisolibacter sp.]